MMRALSRLRSVTARRQLRWIVWGSAVGAVPFVMLYVVPLPGRAFAAVRRVHRRAPRLHPARVRVGHRPLPADGHRGHHQEGAGRGGRGAGAGADLSRRRSAARRASCSGADNERSSFWALFATLIVALVAPWLWRSIQAALDRLYYRDRYDYRRALVQLRARAQQRSRSRSPEHAARRRACARRWLSIASRCFSADPGARVRRLRRRRRARASTGRPRDRSRRASALGARLRRGTHRASSTIRCPRAG